MTAMTAANAIRGSNPPLDYNKRAIIDHLRHQATNGPAYIQHSATKALARTIGLFEEGRLLGKQAFEAARDAAHDVAGQAKDQAKERSLSVYDKIEAIRNGTHVVTAEDLGRYAPSVADDDEEAANQEDDDVP